MTGRNAHDKRVTARSSGAAHFHSKTRRLHLGQVFIRSRKGDSVGIMTGYDSADLQLVAAAVNESLSLNRSQAPAPA